MTGDQASTLHTLPHLLHHIHGQVAGLRAKSHDRTASGWEAPLPFHVDAYDTTHELWALLVDAARAATAATGRPFPVRATLRTGTTPAALRAEAAKITTWLARHLDAIADLPELGYLLHATRAAAARYPLTDRPTRSKEAVCPDDRGALTIRPPRHHGDPQTITCDSCGRTFTEAEHDDAATRFQAVKAHEAAVARANRVRAHLLAKYGLSA